MVKQSFARGDYFRALNLTHDPFQSHYSKSAYFVTPELQHRLDLLRHLLEFSQQILLIKGAPKIGKSNFCQHLIATADPDWIVCQIAASADMGPDDLVKGILHEHMDKIEQITETIAGLNRFLEFCNLNGRVPILFIDDADNLNQASLRFIFQLMEFREQDTFIRIVLIGQDAYLQRLNALAEELSNNNLVHSITIPVFTPEQTTDYLRHRLRACGGREDMFTEKEESRIHKVAAGVVGDINFLARQGLSDPAELLAEKPAVEIAEENAKNTGRIPKLLFVSMILIFSIIAFWLYLQNSAQTDIKTVLVNLPPEPQPAFTNVSNEVKLSSEPLPDAWLESQVPIGSTLVPADALADTSDDAQSIQLNNAADKQKILYDGPAQAVFISAAKPGPEEQGLPEASSKIESGSVKIKGNDWLLAQAADHYVLQLMGAIELATIMQFLQGAGVDQRQVALFKSKQSGKDWHVLVYGLYSDREQARAAISSLSEKVQVQKPWPKSIASIHDAMKSQ